VALFVAVVVVALFVVVEVLFVAV
jgi:hypothetical protein